MLAPGLGCANPGVPRHRAGGCATTKPDQSAPTAALPLKEAVAKSRHGDGDQGATATAQCRRQIPDCHRSMDRPCRRRADRHDAVDAGRDPGACAAAFPMLELLPFTEASLARRPLVLFGAIAAVDKPGSTTPATGRPELPHLWRAGRSQYRQDRCERKRLGAARRCRRDALSVFSEESGLVARSEHYGLSSAPPRHGRVTRSTQPTATGWLPKP